jgi:hypothetical protein
VVEAGGRRIGQVVVDDGGPAGGGGAGAGAEQRAQGGGAGYGRATEHELTSGFPHGRIIDRHSEGGKCLSRKVRVPAISRQAAVTAHRGDPRNVTRDLLILFPEATGSARRKVAK